MRTVEEIKADIEIAFKNKGTDEQRKFILELYETLSADIPLDRLQEICQAERDRAVEDIERFRNCHLCAKIKGCRHRQFNPDDYSGCLGFEWRGLEESE